MMWSRVCEHIPARDGFAVAREELIDPDSAQTVLRFAECFSIHVLRVEPRAALARDDCVSREHGLGLPVVERDRIVRVTR